MHMAALSLTGAAAAAEQNQEWVPELDMKKGDLAAGSITRFVAYHDTDLGEPASMHVHLDSTGARPSALPLGSVGGVGIESGRPVCSEGVRGKGKLRVLTARHAGSRHARSVVRGCVGAGQGQTDQPDHASVLDFPLRQLRQRIRHAAGHPAGH